MDSEVTKCGFNELEKTRDGYDEQRVKDSGVQPTEEVDG